MKIAVSISVHDAYENAQLSAEIIKSNWQKQHKLFLICGLTKNNKEFKKKKIFNKIINISNPKTSYLGQFKEKKNSEVSRSSRLFNSILKTGRIAIMEKCDFIIYLNAGSWVLSISKLMKLLKNLNNKVAGVRIAKRDKYLIIDDHFLIINLKKAKKINLFSQKLSNRVWNTFTVNLHGIHGILLGWLNTIPFKNIKTYYDHSNSINHLGERCYTFNPLHFDNENLFLHSNHKFKYIDNLKKFYLNYYLKKKSNFILKYIGKENKFKNIKIKNNIPILKKRFKPKTNRYSFFKKLNKEKFI
jgi:hypothetical protein